MVSYFPPSPAKTNLGDDFVIVGYYGFIYL